METTCLANPTQHLNSKGLEKLYLSQAHRRSESFSRAKPFTSYRRCYPETRLRSTVLLRGVTRRYYPGMVPGGAIRRCSPELDVPLLIDPRPCTDDIARCLTVLSSLLLHILPLSDIRTARGVAVEVKSWTLYHVISSAYRGNAGFGPVGRGTSMKTSRRRSPTLVLQAPRGQTTAPSRASSDFIGIMATDADERSPLLGHFQHDHAPFAGKEMSRERTNGATVTALPTEERS